MNALFIAGWSSQVARRAHNPEVVGSNPAPATNSEFHFYGVCFSSLKQTPEKLNCSVKAKSFQCFLQWINGVKIFKRISLLFFVKNVRLARGVLRRH